MNDQIRDLLDFVRPELTSAGISLEQRLAPQLPEVVADVGQIRQLLLNLVRNAREAMLGGGAVLVGTRFADGDVYVEVRDTGPGIPPERLARIFDPFFTTKERGTGLGLALAQEIAQEHSGQLTVTSVLGQGTTFTLRLPRAPAERLAQAESRAPEVASTGWGWPGRTPPRYGLRDAPERSRPQERASERPAGRHRRAGTPARRNARRLRPGRLAPRGRAAERSFPLPRASLLPRQRRISRRTAAQFGGRGRRREPERRHHPRPRLLLHACPSRAARGSLLGARGHARAAALQGGGARARSDPGGDPRRGGRGRPRHRRRQPLQAGALRRSSARAEDRGDQGDRLGAAGGRPARAPRPRLRRAQPGPLRGGSVLPPGSAPARGEGIRQAPPRRAAARPAARTEGPGPAPRGDGPPRIPDRAAPLVPRSRRGSP